MEETIKILNIIVSGLFALLALVIIVQSGLDPTIGRYLLTRLIIIILLIGLSMYFALSMRLKKLSEITLLLLFGFFFCVVFIESVLSAFPQIVPIYLIDYFDAKHINALLNAHGIQPINETLTHQDAYSYTPLIKIKQESKRDNLSGVAQIDELGFRNSVQQQQKTDMVILGDSMIFGLGSPVDLGEILRQKGFRVLNLAMPGYAPQNWMKAFKQYGCRTKPKYVSAFLFEGNDFDDAIRFVNPKIKDTSSKIKLTHDPLLNGLIDRSYFLTLTKAGIYIFGLNKRYEEKISVNGKSLTVRYLSSPPSLRSIQNNGSYDLVMSTIKGLQQECNKTGAQFRLFYLPVNTSVYAGYSKRLTLAQSDHNAIVSAISEDCKKEGISFTDCTDKLQASWGKERVFLHMEKDVHLHPEGLGMLANIVVRELTQSQKPEK